MQKRIFFCFTICTLLLSYNSVKAQQEPGQIVINAGVGYSPGFDGDLGFADYPAPTVFGSFSNWNTDENPPFMCSSIIPNIGGTIDIGITKQFSIGLAGSYQSEVVNWTPTPSNPPYPNHDKIARTNAAGRFLFHIIKANTYFDLYTGIRLGLCYWGGIPSPDNQLIPTGYNNNGNPGFGLATFLNTPNLVVLSLQALIGLRYYPIKCLGIHIEAGIGSPYLVEGGLAFRINTHKEEINQPTSTSDNSKK